MIASFSIIVISTIVIAYLSIYIGHLLGKWSNDELKYKNYYYTHLFLFILFSSICLALNFYIAPAIVFLCYLLFRTSYIWNLMYFFIGLSLILTPYFEFTVSIAVLYGLTYGAIVRTMIAYPNKEENKDSKKNKNDEKINIKYNKTQTKKELIKHNILKRSTIMSFLNSLGIFLGLGIGIAIRLIFK